MHNGAFICFSTNVVLVIPHAQFFMHQALFLLTVLLSQALISSASVLLSDSEKLSEIMMAGGFKGAEKADADVQEVLNSVKDAAAASIGKDVGDFTALTYSSQVVAGTNYVIEAQISETECYHVRIFKPLPHTGAPNEFKGAKGPHAPGATLQK